MHPHRTAAIISCGDELTLGQKLDTNSRWIAEQLLDRGILPIEHVTVPDELAAQTQAFTRLASRVDLIVCSGGLGPTADDLTRQALADATGDTLTRDPAAAAQIEAFFKARGRTMAPINLTQADRPSRGACIRNDHGTAPGLSAAFVSSGHACDIYCLPGPPREMFPMFHAAVVPALRPPPGLTIRTRVLHTAGIGESDLAQLLGDLMRRDRALLIGTTASMGTVAIRLRYEGDRDPAGADQLLNQAEAEIRTICGKHIFGSGDDTLASVVIRQLRERGQSLAVVESCTGGMVGQTITAVPGSSDVFAGGLTTYSNAMKQSLARVPAALFKSDASPDAPGAVSRQCAGAMASGGLDVTGADWCLSVTGIAGPGGAIDATPTQPAKPVGTVFIGLASRAQPHSIDVRRFNMAGDRASVREWSVRAALSMLHFALAGNADIRLLRQAVD